MSKRKFTCSECSKREWNRHKRTIRALPDKEFCSIECYMKALRKEYPTEIKNASKRKKSKEKK